MKSADVENHGILDPAMAAVNETAMQQVHGDETPNRIAGRSPKAGWTRTEEAVPAPYQVVMICFNNRFKSVKIRALGYRITDSYPLLWSTDVVYEYPNEDIYDDIEVTHWMLLPDLPKE